VAHAVGVMTKARAKRSPAVAEPHRNGLAKHARVVETARNEGLSPASARNNVMPPRRSRRDAGDAVGPRASIGWDGARPVLLRWYDEQARDLPWRSAGRSPYRVLVSEFMLQQTQVATVIPYFERFVAELPDVRSLVGADEERVLPPAPSRGADDRRSVRRGGAARRR